VRAPCRCCRTGLTPNPLSMHSSPIHTLQVLLLLSVLCTFSSHLPYSHLPSIALMHSSPIHRRFIYEEHMSTHAQGTDPRVALGAYGELPWKYLGARGEGRRRDPVAVLRAGPPLCTLSSHLPCSHLPSTFAHSQLRYSHPAHCARCGARRPWRCLRSASHFPLHQSTVHLIHSVPIHTLQTVLDAARSGHGVVTYPWWIRREGL